MASRFAAVTNKEISLPIMQAVPGIHKEVTKFGLEVLTGKALSFLLEFIYETCEKFFCLSLALLYLVDLFISQLKTKFNNLFYRMILILKKKSQLLMMKFPCKS